MSEENINQSLSADIKTCPLCLKNVATENIINSHITPKGAYRRLGNKRVFVDPANNLVKHDNSQNKKYLFCNECDNVLLSRYEDAFLSYIAFDEKKQSYAIVDRFPEAKQLFEDNKNEDHFLLELKSNYKGGKLAHEITMYAMTIIYRYFLDNYEGDESYHDIIEFLRGCIINSNTDGFCCMIGMYSQFSDGSMSVLNAIIEPGGFDLKGDVYEIKFLHNGVHFLCFFSLTKNKKYFESYLKSVEAVNKILVNNFYKDEFTIRLAKRLASIKET